MEDNNVKIISKKDLKEIFTYVNKTYGKDFLKSLKTKK